MTPKNSLPVLPCTHITCHTMPLSVIASVSKRHSTKAKRLMTQCAPTTSEHTNDYMRSHGVSKLMYIMSISYILPHSAVLSFHKTHMYPTIAVLNHTVSWYTIKQIFLFFPLFQVTEL